MGIKYTYSFLDPTDTLWNVEISTDEYSGAPIPLKGSSIPLELSLTPRASSAQERRWTRANGSITMRISDIASGILKELFDALPNQYRVHCYPTVGSIAHGLDGFIQPGDYNYQPFINGQEAIVQATDNLGLLDRLAYIQDNGSLYTGEALLKDVVHQCLRKTGMGLGYAFHNMYYPSIGVNELTYDNDVMAHYLVDQDEFLDDNGNPYSCGYVLDQALGKYNLRVYQWAGVWRIDHRDKDTDSAITGGQTDFRSYRYDSDGNPLSGVAFYEELPSLYAIEEAADYKFKKGTQIVSGSPAVGTVSNVYLHGNPFKDLFTNMGFEDPIANSGNDGAWVVSNTNAVPIEQVGAGESVNSLRFDAKYQLNGASPIESYATEWARQKSKGVLAGGNGRRLRVSFKAQVNELTDTGLFLPFLVYNEEGYWWDWVNSTWETSEVINLLPITQFQFGLNRFEEFNAVTPLLEDTGTPFSSKVTIEFRSPVEANDPVNGQTIPVYLWLDDVDLDVIDANNNLPAEALRIIASRSDSENLDSSLERVFLFGQGPTAGHQSREKHKIVFICAQHTIWC
jgi:hypothetical protein